jgi:hypothetical protein
MCEHSKFAVHVDVNRLCSKTGGPITHFSAYLQIKCAECGTPFYFVGQYPVGCSPYGPTINLAATELMIPMMPEGQLPPKGLPSTLFRNPGPTELH